MISIYYRRHRLKKQKYLGNVRNYAILKLCLVNADTNWIYMYMREHWCKGVELVGTDTWKPGNWSRTPPPPPPSNPSFGLDPNSWGVLS